MWARIALVIVVVALVCAPAGASKVEGSFSYDGEAVSTVFPSFQYASAAAWNNGSSQWVRGTVDLGAGTYEVDGLAAGTWYVVVLVGPQDFAGRVTVWSNEVIGWETGFEVNDGATMTLDLECVYAYHITQPLDSGAVWPGSITDCPYGPPVADTFTFAWDPVPRAASYEVVVQRYSCGGSLASETSTPAALSVEIQQGQVAGEAFMTVEVRAWSSASELLTVVPYVRYGNGSGQSAYLHGSGGGGSGRFPHPSSSVFVPQIAHLPGVPPSVWSSDLILTNPTASPIAATLTFTPRDADGSTNFQTTSVTVPAGACRVFADVLSATLASSGAGSLEVSPATLEVTSRISTPRTGGGTYGQGYPAVGPDDVVYVGGPSTTLGAGGVSKGTTRTNLALVETWGESVTLTVRLTDRDGVELGTKTVNLDPYGNTQINDLVGQLGGPSTIAEGQVTVSVTSGGGRVAAVLSVVDQGSQDPTTLRLVRR